jgi:hypothetical protein
MIRILLRAAAVAGFFVLVAAASCVVAFVLN